MCVCVCGWAGSVNDLWNRKTFHQYLHSKPLSLSNQRSLNERLPLQALYNGIDCFNIIIRSPPSLSIFRKRREEQLFNVAFS